MFSWSHNSNNGKSGTATFPATRRTGGQSGTSSSASSSSFIAPTIPGSVRPSSFSSVSSSGTSMTGNYYTRAQHMESYLGDDSLRRSTKTVSSDDTTHDTVFQSVVGDTLILRVYVPPSAAHNNQCPVPILALVGVKARHPWLDSRMRVVGFEPTSSEQAWHSATNRELLLGQAVHQVVEHFQLNPPEILEFTDPGLERIQSRRPAPPAPSSQQIPPPPEYETVLEGANNISISNSVTSNSRYQSRAAIELPPFPREIEELKNLDRKELEALLGDELEFLAFCHKLQYLQTVESIAGSIIDENARCAKKNLENEEGLKKLYVDVRMLQDQLKSKVETFQELEKRQKEILTPPDKRHAIRELNKAKKQAFDESEAFAQAWLDEGTEGGSKVESFIDAFMEKRKLHHVRAGKVELLEHGSWQI